MSASVPLNLWERTPMKVKCISSRLRHVHFVEGKAVLIKVGDVFEVARIPQAWSGLVVPLEADEPKVDEPKADDKKVVTNPATGGGVKEEKK
jgi:hypothetical protein